MNEEFTPADIVWVKNVTDHNIHQAYMDVNGNPFLLHFPNHFHPGNVLHPAINKIILIRQMLNGQRAFTHLVSPIDNEIVDENVHAGFRYGRTVQVVAITPLLEPILAAQTEYPYLYTRGNACQILNFIRWITYLTSKNYSK